MGNFHKLDQLMQPRPLCAKNLLNTKHRVEPGSNTKNRVSSVGKTLIPEQAQNIDSGLVQKTQNFELILVGWVASCVAEWQNPKTWSKKIIWSKSFLESSGVEQVHWKLAHINPAIISFLTRILNCLLGFLAKNSAGFPVLILEFQNPVICTTFNYSFPQNGVPPYQTKPDHGQNWRWSAPPSCRHTFL